MFKQWLSSVGWWWVAGLGIVADTASLFGASELPVPLGTLAAVSLAILLVRSYFVYADAARQDPPDPEAVAYRSAVDSFLAEGQQLLDGYAGAAGDSEILFKAAAERWARAAFRTLLLHGGDALAVTFATPHDLGAFTPTNLFPPDPAVWMGDRLSALQRLRNGWHP